MSEQQSAHQSSHDRVNSSGVVASLVNGRGRRSVVLIFCIVMLILIAWLVFRVFDRGPSSPDSAKQLIKKAQDAIHHVTAYHFNLAAQHPGSTGDFTIQSANGDIIIPDKLSADPINVLTALGTVQVKFVAIGEQQYVTNPITGIWQPTTGLLNPRSLSDQQTGVAALLGHMQNLSTPSDSNVDGAPCWSIDGVLDAKYLQGITGGGTAANSLVDTTTCIGKSDHLPYLIHMKGKATDNDKDDTERTFKLSKFNEHVTITAPI